IDIHDKDDAEENDLDKELVEIRKQLELAKFAEARAMGYLEKASRALTDYDLTLARDSYHRALEYAKLARNGGHLPENPGPAVRGYEALYYDYADASQKELATMAETALDRHEASAWVHSVQSYGAVISILDEIAELNDYLDTESRKVVAEV